MAKKSSIQKNLKELKWRIDMQKKERSLKKL